MKQLYDDLRFAARQWRNSPGFALAAVLTLALGIGANTAIFTVYQQVLLRRLPVPDPQRLVILSEKSQFETGSLDTWGGPNDQAFAYPAYQALRDHNHVLRGLAASAYASSVMVTPKSADHINLELVSGNYFNVLQVKPLLGRLISPADDVVHAGNPVAVLSAGYWRSHFGGDPSVLNSQIQIGGKPFTIVGVVEHAGLLDSTAPAFFIPIGLEREVKREGSYDRLADSLYAWITLVGRLAPGVDRKQADAELNTIWWDWRRDTLAARSHNIPDKKNWLITHLSVEDGARGVADLQSTVGKPLRILEGMTVVVLLIACANIANLLLVKAARRQAELALRGALGASRGRLFRQVVTEGLLLGLAGAAVGFALGWAGLHSILKVIPENSGLGALHAEMDWRVLAFCAVTGVACSLLFSVAPALVSMRVDLMRALHGQSGAVASGGTGLRSLLVASEIALSLALLVSASMLAWTLYRLRTVNLGYSTTHLLTFSMNASALGKPDPEVRNEYQQIEEAMRREPGVTGVAYALLGLVSGNESGSGLTVSGYTAGNNEPIPDQNRVTPGFFSVMQIPLIAGREFNAEDREGDPKVAIVDDAFVKHYFQGDANAALGRMVGFGWGNNVKLDIQIVGVMPVIHSTQIGEAPGRPFIYLSYDQGFGDEKRNNRDFPATFYMRTRGAPAALAKSVRQNLHSIDPSLPINMLETMQEHIGDQIFQQRLMAMLASAMGALALLLAAIGLYGVLAFTVAQRTREIGIRIALGADKVGITALVLKHMARVVAVGVAAGAGLAWLAVRLLQSQDSGMHMAPLWLEILLGVGLLSVMLAACYLPARKAASVDPMVALRME